MSTAPVTWKRRSRITPTRVLLYGFLIVTAALWLVPIVGAVFASLRVEDFVGLVLDQVRGAKEGGVDRGGHGSGDYTVC